jgi:hypothetical protein
MTSEVQRQLNKKGLGGVYRVTRTLFGNNAIWLKTLAKAMGSDESPLKSTS